MLLIPIKVVYTRGFLLSIFVHFSSNISVPISLTVPCTQLPGSLHIALNPMEILHVAVTKQFVTFFVCFIHLYDALLLLHLFRRIYLFNHLMHVSFCIEFVTLHERIKTELLNAWMLSQRMNGFYSNILVSLLVPFHSFPVPWCQDFVCFLLMTGSP